MQNTMRTRTTRSTALATGALALTLLLSACGGGEGVRAEDGAAGRSDGVASLDDGRSKAPETTRSAPAKAADEGRPQWRLDSTDEEINRLWDRYYGCLKTNGVRFVPARDAKAPGPDSGDPTHEVVAEPDKREPKAAYDACDGTMPMMPDELDEKKNPKYREQFAAQVTCMQKKGAEVTLNPDFSGWTYATSTPKLSEKEIDDLDRACMLEAFGGKR
ncbi:hypothetical protein AB4225_05130 [Streptomyces sp. 2RAF24]|uniref:hypothetical protein n=1 Tax=Streptomyces sp. 2RAF24 TaxID=3232997 RepID=UPI003F98D20D